MASARVGRIGKGSAALRRRKANSVTGILSVVFVLEVTQMPGGQDVFDKSKLMVDTSARMVFTYGLRRTQQAATR